jgi:hypothetical protein
MAAASALPLLCKKRLSLQEGKTAAACLVYYHW